jgi:pyrroloquinoline quinone (PQQ) biosynthesis protein C
MNVADLHLRAPRFRSGVRWILSSRSVRFSYSKVAFSVEFSENAASWIDRLCRDLAGGLDTTALADDFGDFSNHAAEIVVALDRYGMLDESAPQSDYEVISGRAFWREVEALVERMTARCTWPMYDFLRSPAVTREVLVAYAIQYLHIVAAAPSIIGTALAHCDRPETKHTLEQFLRSELGHDSLLRAALAAAGLEDDDVEASLPIPETFAISSALSVFAAQEPLTFKASLFLLEQNNPQFHDALTQACKTVAMPTEFLTPLLAHAGINAETLLSQVDVVAAEERIVSLKQVASMVEALSALEVALVKSARSLA